MRFLKSVLTLFIILIAIISHAQVDLNNGLQAYYPFNGNANDASGHGNNPIVVNDVALTNDYYGNPNSAYHFNGTSSYIQIPNSTSLNSANTISVCLWMKPLGFYLGKCHHNRLIMKGLDNNGSNSNYDVGYGDHLIQNGNSCSIPDADTLHETAYGGGTAFGSLTDTTTFIAENVWQSLVWTYDGVYARMYVDCKLTIENYYPGASFSNAYDLFIGKMNDPQYPYYFNGIMDEVRIYNRALNIDEIKAYSLSCKNDFQGQSLCTGSLGDPIINITFGKGENPGAPLNTIVPDATTTYNFVSVFGNPASPVPNDGSYTITNNVPANLNWFLGATDHTGDGNGYMAFFNANPVPGEFYKQTVSNLCPGTSYQFSAWIANVLDPSRIAGVLPDITFRIAKPDGTLLASYKTSGIPQTSSMTWNQYGFFFTTPADGSTVVLTMSNTNVGGDALPGNDFAIDDITFRACGADASASFNSNTIQTSLTVAPSGSFTLYGSVYPVSNNYDYLWQYSNDGGISWKDVANSNKISILQTAPANSSTTILYRMLNAQKGNIGSPNCRVTSNSITLNVSSDSSDNSQCNNWLKINSNGSGIRTGDIDISGQKITVEAVFNRTQTYTGGRLYAGDIVSKHKDPSDANYLLRPNSAEITTSNGYFITPPVCDADLNKTYQVAMVYDGETLKFYRDGFLMSQVSCSGNLYQNDYVTTIGASAYNPNGAPDESMRGYINEVRIWNTVRTQKEIRQYINQSLPNPQSQTGLVAYYTFNNLVNKQGNPKWNSSLLGSAQINQTNPQCTFTEDSCSVIATPVIVDFTAPDTVCVNTLFTVKNTSTGQTTNYWNFCSPNLLDKPAITNLGNPDFSFHSLVYTDYVFVNGNYYMFLVNNSNGGSIVRLDFGNSLLNTPSPVTLSSVSPYLTGSTEGIQLIRNNGKWIAIVVGGDPKSFTPSQILKIDFGSTITSTSPAVTDWGNIGNLNYPHDLYLYQENNHWYGFTANTYANNIVKFDFGTDFSTTPIASTLLSLSDYPVGLYAYFKNNNRYLFITNAGTNGVNSTLTRLDFSSSFSNSPVVHDLGNPGVKLYGAYDFTTVENCNQLIGLAANTDNSIARFSFPNADITQIPVFIDTVASGNLNFPHSFSNIYREGSDAYFFIPNAYNSTLSRLEISGCTNASQTGTSNTNPGSISYNTPGTYTISLTVDEGLSTQATICKDITVLAIPKQAPPKDTSFCEGTSIRLVTSFPNGIYLWNTGSTDSAIRVSQPGKYWVQINNGSGCGVVDSFDVKMNALPVVNLGKDTGLCSSQTLLLNAGNSGSNYLWQDVSIKSTYNVVKGGNYFVTVTNASKCSKADTIKVADYPSPVLSNLKDAKICTGNTAQLSVTANGTGNTYSWSPANTLNNAAIANPTAKPLDTTNYTVTVTNSNGCISKDTAIVFVLVKPTVASIQDTGFCVGNSVTLQTTSANAISFSWSPSAGLDNAKTASPKASPVSTTSYIVTATNEACGVSDTVKLTVFALPDIITNNDTTVCGTTSVQLRASGGSQYRWSPAAGLSNAGIANPIASVNQPVTYTVTGTDKNGCVNTDSVRITNLLLTQFSASASLSAVCPGDSVLLTASGGDGYAWQPSQTVLHPFDSSTYAVPTSSTTYTVQISNAQCHTSETKDVVVSVNAIPQLTIAKSNDIDCRNPTAVLTASGGSSYTWSPSADGIDSGAVLMVKPEKTTVYHVTTSSDNGCAAADTITVKVNTLLLDQYQVASAFTPNGDGINDCFGIRSWDVLRVDFQVYDQWGFLLFHSTDPSNVCWDGRYKGKNQLDGTYVYKIYAVTSCGILNRSGTFVLIRAAR